MNIYLAGAINGKSDAECIGWREQYKSMLPGNRFLDPMDRDYRGREDENVEEIVRGDMIDIRLSDAVVAWCEAPSWGTAMEIRYAHQIGRRVVVIVPDGPVSPWLRFHATEVVGSLAEAKEIVTGWERGKRVPCRSCGQPTRAAI